MTAPLHPHFPTGASVSESKSEREPGGCGGGRRAQGGARAQVPPVRARRGARAHSTFCPGFPGKWDKTTRVLARSVTDLRVEQGWSGCSGCGLVGGASGSGGGHYPPYPPFPAGASVSESGGEREQGV